MFEDFSTYFILDLRNWQDSSSEEERKLNLTAVSWLFRQQRKYSIFLSCSTVTPPQLATKLLNW